MKAINTIRLIGAASVAVLLTGCFDEKMPEVNDTNCQIENIKKIENKAMQQDFATKCLRRGNPRSGEFKASPNKEW